MNTDNVSSNTTNNPLKLENRNNRVLFVLAILGGIYALIEQIVPWMTSEFTRTINVGRNPFQAQHFITPIIIAGGLSMIVLCVRYAFYEARSYSRQNNAKWTEILESADKSYEDLLKSVPVYLITTTLSFFVVYVIFTPNALPISGTPLLICLGTLGVLLIGAGCILLHHHGFQKTARFIWDGFGRLITLWALIFFIATTTFLLLFDLRITRSIDIVFSGNSMTLTFQQFHPKSVTVRILNTNPKNGKPRLQTISPSQFLSASAVEILQSKNSKGDSEAINLNNTSNLYTETLELDRYFTTGDNTIIIDVDCGINGSQTRQFEFSNDVFVNKGTMQYAQKSFDAKF